jgi:hypothetical protein
MIALTSTPDQTEVHYDRGEALSRTAMLTELMVQPSSWVETGITVETVRGLKLFKFTEDLQERFEQLIELYKQDQLTGEQEAELKGLAELDRIFTLLNARSIAHS